MNRPQFIFKMPILLWAATIIPLTAVAADRHFDVQVFGNYQRMKYTGDATGKIKLQDVTGVSGSYGMGALAGLGGEVLLFDGKMLVTDGSDPHGNTRLAASNEEATLFVTAKVQARRHFRIPGNAFISTSPIQTFRPRGMSICMKWLKVHCCYFRVNSQVLGQNKK